MQAALLREALRSSVFGHRARLRVVGQPRLPRRFSVHLASQILSLAFSEPPSHTSSGADISTLLLRRKRLPLRRPACSWKRESLCARLELSGTGRDARPSSSALLTLPRERVSCCQSLLQPRDPSFQSLHPPASSTLGLPPASATPPRHATQGPAPPPTTSASAPLLPRIARQLWDVSPVGLRKRHSARELLGVSHASSIDTRESFCLGAAARRWTAGSGLVALARHDGANASRAHCGAVGATVSFSDRRPSRLSASCSPGDCSRAGRGCTEDGASARRSHTIADGRECAASSPMHTATTSSSAVARSFCIPSQPAYFSLEDGPKGVVSFDAVTALLEQKCGTYLFLSAEWRPKKDSTDLR